MEKKPNGYWNYERCREEALKYDKVSYFRKNSCSAYSKIIRNEWFELLEHFNFRKNIKVSGYWTYDRCRDAVLECESLDNLNSEYGGAYSAIYKNNWLYLLNELKRDECQLKRLVYVYEFYDNSFYVGLTCNIKRRNKQHISTDIKSAVYKHIKKTCDKPVLKLLSDYIEVENAVLLEEVTLNEYIKNGWTPLNSQKTGGTGGSIIKWTKKAVYNEAIKYSESLEFKKKSPKAYRAMIRNKWVMDVGSHLKFKKSPNGYWNNKELCYNESLKYGNEKLFRKNNKTAYKYSKENGWLNEFFTN